MLGTQIVRDTGIVAQAGSISADPESRLLIQLTQFMDLATPFLAWTIDRTRELYSPSSDDIVDALYHSPAFDPDRRDLIRNGIEAYLSDDFVKGVHVLLPQIEHTLLRLAENLGVVTRKPSRHNPNAMQWINLYEVLQDGRVQECLGEDLTCYLQVLLVDPLGHNIRNHVCHGHLKPEDFTRQLADRVFHVLLTLSLIRERRDAKQD
jgi:lysyl-tRNA synthetase class 1